MNRIHRSSSLRVDCPSRRPRLEAAGLQHVELIFTTQSTEVGKPVLEGWG
ncbi:hypothetical protein WMF27_00635 [Sorangium sp. So ce281]